MSSFTELCLISMGIEITVRVRVDPTEPMLLPGVTVFEDIAGRPVLVVRDVQVDPADVGEAVLRLLHDPDPDADDDL